jgi:peptidoglycan/xylan/chitin deacetylase (PgdA/CDA1 family)
VRVAIVVLVLGAILVSFTAALAYRPTPGPTAAAVDAPTTAPTSAGSAQPAPTGTVVSPVPSGPASSPDPTPERVCTTPPAEATPAALVRHGSRDSKVVALTFDDGWIPENVAGILAILEKAKVNATFFPIGRAIKASPATWKAVAAAGFPIGNHTYDHKRLTLLCYEDQVAELFKQDEVIGSVLGLTPLPYMRPPYGAYNGITRLAASSTGNPNVVLWDVDTRDWSGISARAITARALVGTNGSIVIMHTIATNTVAALPSIIARYRARGFTFVTVGQILGIDGPVPFR